MYLKLRGDRSKHLLQYSISAITFLTAIQSNAQVVYTDLDPDITIDAPGGIYELDLDNNSLEDYIFSASSLSFISSTVEGVYQNFINAVFADPVSSNSIAAPIGIISGFAYPFALESNIVIDGVTEFTNLGFQSLAYSFYAIKDGSLNIPITSVGAWLNGKTDKFIGFKFKIGANSHYGWARLDVSTENNSFTIKDYAYESTPDASITTELISVSIEENNQAAIVSYCAGNIFYVHLPESLVKSTDGTLQLIGLNGNLVQAHQIIDKTHAFDFSSLLPGIYIAHIQVSGQSFTKKIFVE